MSEQHEDAQNDNIDEPVESEGLKPAEAADASSSLDSEFDGIDFDELTAALNDIAEEAKPPFFTLAFSMAQGNGVRSRFNMSQQEGGDYKLTVKQTRPGDEESGFTRNVPASVARSVRDGLQAAGAYSWEPEYGDDKNPGSIRWNLSVVFEKDVFTLELHGGSDVPEGFSTLLETFYEQDLPRPEGSRPKESAGAGFFGMPDMSKLFGSMPGGPDMSMFKDMQEAMADMQNNPEKFRSQLRDEFRSMPSDMQKHLIDMLASTGMGSRDWWEKFLRG